MCDPTARQFATSYNHCCRWKPLNTLNLYLEQIMQNKPKGGLLDYTLVPLMTENIQNHHFPLLSIIIVLECIMFSLKKKPSQPMLSKYHFDLSVLGLLPWESDVFLHISNLNLTSSLTFCH